MHIYSGPIWVYFLIQITPFVFGAVLNGLTIGYLSSQEDVWKLTIGVMGVASIANILIILGIEITWLMTLQILWLFACNTIIFLVTYFVSQNKLKKFDLIEQQELTDEEFALLESIGG